MRTTSVDGRFLLLNPLLFWQFAHPVGFSDRIHFHRYTLCIGRNPLRDVPVERAIMKHKNQSTTFDIRIFLNIHFNYRIKRTHGSACWRNDVVYEEEQGIFGT